MKNEVQHINGKRIVTPEYTAWQLMKNRCLNPNCCSFKYYGAKGITFSARWKKFDNFLIDMGRKPTKAHSLERKKSSANYCKRNCKWATAQEQAQNREWCVVTIATAKKIRVLYATGFGDQKKLAKKFNIAQQVISDITSGVSWKNAGGPIIRASRRYRSYLK